MANKREVISERANKIKNQYLAPLLLFFAFEVLGFSAQAAFHTSHDAAT